VEYGIEKENDLFITGKSGDSKNLLDELDEIVNLRQSEMEREHELVILEQKMKYAQLQNQINPHFLYNTLENIRGQAIIDDNYLIADMTEALSRFFRYNISKDNDIVRLADELDNIRTYIQIQQYRFRDRFIFRIHNHDETDGIYRCMIPKMTLQPIVENAIFHGIENKVDTGYIDVHIERSGIHVIVLVSDDGIGMDEDSLEKLNQKLNDMKQKVQGIEEKDSSNGIAMENVNKRLRLLYGEEYGIIVSSTHHVGTEVEIILPYVPEQQP
jgi:two-component system sensor histidine kinase YesM